MLEPRIAAPYLSCMPFHRELFEGTKDAGIAIVVVVILFGIAVGIAFFLHFV